MRFYLIPIELFSRDMAEKRRRKRRAKKVRKAKGENVANLKSERNVDNL